MPDLRPTMKVHLPDLHLFGFTNQPEAIFAIYVQIYLVHQFVFSLLLDKSN